jgi:2-polyprenyl-6-methoxyphenol hydroxylase-like FAD-dependent oxidoreductase
VLERATSLDPVGYALVMSANALAALERLGVADAVRSVGEPAETVRVRSARGRVLVELDGAELETVGVRRAELQCVLREALPEDTVQLGRAVTGVADAGEADLVVGADGIGSVVRGELFPDTEIRYGGHAGWRALVRDPGVERTFTETWGPGARFGFGHVGGGWIYWYVAESVREGAPEPADPLGEFRRRFADWHDPIPRIVEATEPDVLSRTFVYDLRPLRSWSRGRVTLVGDAAHAMTPNLGQGAAQALEDAVALGASLRDADDVESALRLYESHRVKRANALLRASRQAGATAQLESPLACRLRDAALAALPAHLKTAQQRRFVRVELPRLTFEGEPAGSP